jgi:hypothetical protein
VKIDNDKISDKFFGYDHRQCSKLQYNNFRQLTFYRVTIPEAAYIQLRRRPHEDEQGNAPNM